MPSPSHLTQTNGDVLLAIRAQPRASRNQIGDVVDGELRVRIATPPVDAAANQELIRFLAKTLSGSKSAITIARGERSRHKTLRIRGMDLASLPAALTHD